MATISDIAAKAGVGIGTVSRVLNGSHQVRPTTRARVQAAMEELDYHPTRSGAGRAGRHQRFVGVLVPHFDEPSTYQRLRGIVRALQPHGLEVVLYNVDAPDRARQRLLEVPRHQLDGLIIVSLPLRSDEGDRLAQAQFPIVLVDTSHPALPSVVVDDRYGGRIATDYLLSLGHEHIAFLGEPERNPFGFVSSRNREAGYAGAHRRRRRRGAAAVREAWPSRPDGGAPARLRAVRHVRAADGRRRRVGCPGARCPRGGACRRHAGARATCQWWATTTSTSPRTAS